MKNLSLLWIRQDLRLRDNPALLAAIRDGAVIPVYVLDHGSDRNWFGAAQRWWLHHSLSALGADYVKTGSRLILRRGRAADVLTALIAETGAVRVHALRHYEPWWQRAESELGTRADLILHDGNLRPQRVNDQ